MMKNDEDDKALIDLIEETRGLNNVNWMAILKIAMKHAPKETKGVLKSILAKDTDIHYYLERLSED